MNISLQTSILRRFWRARRGVAAVEFALLVPVFALIAVGAAEFGSIGYTRFALESSVSAATSYAIANASSVSSTSGASLASNISSVLTSSWSSGWANGSVTVNNGPASTATSGTTTPSGTASNADSCYCPTLVSGTLTWGSTATCGSSCTSGGVAGKFVSISASKSYSPIFAGYGIVKSGTITVKSVVQVQ